jgi:hypothetical protein
VVLLTAGANCSLYTPLGKGDCLISPSVVKPAGNPMGICNNFMNNLEIGLWKEYKAEAKKRSGIITESAFNPRHTLPKCVTHKNVPVV